MTEHERFLFDLQGFLEIPDALSPTDVQSLNEILDSKCSEEMPQDASSCRFMGDLISWGDPYRNLIDCETLLPYLDAILGQQYRLDHDYLDVIRGTKEPIGSSLHGGQTSYDSTYAYNCHNGEIRCGLIAVAYNLKDVNAGDGEFGCVPGSHKSNFTFPAEWSDLENVQPFMRRITGPAGTAILFTEALIHGTLPWLGDERRTVFMKYAPKSMAWYSCYYDADSSADLTDRQRAMLEAPNARYDGRENPRPRIRLR